MFWRNVLAHHCVSKRRTLASPDFLAGFNTPSSGAPVFSLFDVQPAAPAIRSAILPVGGRGDITLFRLPPQRGHFYFASNKGL